MKHNLYKMRFPVLIALALPVAAVIWFFVRRWKLLVAHETEVEVPVTRASSIPPNADSEVDQSGLQPAQNGEGVFYSRTYQVDIQHPKLSKEALLQSILQDINHFTPQEMAYFEKTRGAQDTLEIGDEFLVRITGPWNGPVRLVDLQPDSFAFATLHGHLEAGKIQFIVLENPDHEGVIRFEIRSWARSSSKITDFFYRVLGISKFSQTRMWSYFCDKVVEQSGGERLGDINVMTHKTPNNRQQEQPLWKQYSSQLDHWSSIELNFDPSKQEEFNEINGWFIDDYQIGLPSEPPGEPVANGAWGIAKGIISNYEFPDPSLISGIFVPDQPLNERLMIVKAHFLVFTFVLGVRISKVIDELRDTGKRGQARVWGYSYSTLNGHFEMGEITFEVWKYLETGEVEFRIHAYSKPAHISNPFYRLGFRIFGRSLQKRFGATSLERMQRLVLERITSSPQPQEPLQTPEVKPISSDEAASDKVDEITEGKG